MAFPEKDLLKDYQYRMAEAKKRDHRNVGTQQGLFMFNQLSPGSCFFLPHGAAIYNSLMEVRSSLPSPRGSIPMGAAAPDAGLWPLPLWVPPAG